MTWSLHERFPGRILTAEVTPENPQSVHDLGFDSVWVHRWVLRECSSQLRGNLVRCCKFLRFNRAPLTVNLVP